MAKVKRMMFGGAAKGMGSAGKPSATPPAGLNVAGIRKASAGLGDTFKPANAAAALRKLPMPPQAGAAPTPQMAAAAYKKMQPVQGAGQLARNAATTGPARGISRGDLKMAGLMKKGGAVKKKATKK